MYEPAIEAGRKLRLARGDPPEQVEKGFAEIESTEDRGERGFWQSALERIEKTARENDREVNPLDIARIQLGLGNKEQALDSLEKAFASGKHYTGMTYLRSFPAWDPLRSEPQFKALLRKVGLPE